MATKAIPKLVAHLGKPFSRVIDDSTHTFDQQRIASMLDRSHYVVEAPSQLVYDDPDIPFEVPPGRYVWISVAAGRVFEITTGATEEAIPLKEAYDRGKTLAERLVKLPFTERGQLRRNYDDLVDEMAEITRDGYEVDLLRCKKGDVYVQLTLRWLGSAAPSRQNAYILSMCWSNETLYDELMTKVREKRRAHGDETTALGLGEWLGVTKD